MGAKIWTADPIGKISRVEAYADELEPYEAVIFAIYCAAQDWQPDTVSFIAQDFEHWNQPKGSFEGGRAFFTRPMQYGGYYVLPFAPLAWMIRVALANGEANPE